MLVITVACSKGGVGKTTTAINLAHGFARRGQRVMLIDLDQLGQAAIGFGLEPSPGVYDLLVKERTRDQIAVPVRDNLWLTPGDSETKWAENHLLMRQQSAASVAARLVSYAEGCDVLVLDTPPGGFVQEVGLLAATVTVVPATPDYQGAQGSANLLSLRETLQVNGPLVVLPTMYDGRLARHRNMKEEFAVFAQDSGVLLSEPFPLRDEVREMWQVGATVWEHQAQGRGRNSVAELSHLFENLMNLLEEAVDDPERV